MLAHAQPRKLVVNQPLPHMGIRPMKGKEIEGLRESFYRKMKK
jgi:hypothetical protein